VLVNSEANAILRSQIDEIHDNMYALSKEEFDAYKSMQRDFNALKAQTAELTNNSEYQVNLLQKAESERLTLKTQLEAVVSTMSSQALEIQQLRSAAATDNAQLSLNKREMARQQKECEELKSQLKELKDIPVSKDREVGLHFFFLLLLLFPSL
jgi:capsule polysaccharide export protein KpsE/RkpR